jgi:predicted ester cyclase
MAQIEDMLERLFTDGVNNQDYGVMDEVLAENYTNHSFGASGRDSMKGTIQQFHAAFSDLQVVVDERVSDGDRAAQRGHFTGKHTGEFMGMAPSNSDVTIQWMDWWEARDGLLCDNWVVMDFSPLAQ